MVCLLIVVLIMFVLVIIVYTTKINSFLILEAKMKSLMITKYGDVNSSLEEQEVPKPAVKANQILIKTYSSSFNPVSYTHLTLPTIYSV